MRFCENVFQTAIRVQTLLTFLTFATTSVVGWQGVMFFKQGRGLV